MTGNAPPVALTMGEPAGIGAEIALRAWLALRGTDCAFFLLHDPEALSEVARRLSMDVPFDLISHPREARSIFADRLPILRVDLAAAVEPGRPDARNAAAVVGAIRRAVDLTVAGEASAVVTNPVQKATLYESGFRFPGHTEFLQALAGPACRATMMLASEALRVVPVSIHEPLAAAVAGLSRDRIVEVARAAEAGLRGDFGVRRPRLAVAGLNPHAGEEGSLGREEIELIGPAVQVLRREGIDATGPYPPDTLFTARSRTTYDAAICMYHDQALIPLKTLDADGGVNVTMGLPFVRTSPDHGTALNIAGRGLAHPGSLIAAVRMAARIAGHRTELQGAQA